MFVEVVIPPPQSKVAPEVREEAASVTLVAKQVSTNGGAMLIFGRVPF